MVLGAIMRRTEMALIGLLGCSMLSGCGAGGTPGFEPASDPGYSLSSLGNILAFNKLFPGSAPLPQTDAKVECPTIEVQDGTSSVRVFSGGDQSNDQVRYGFSLGETARECSKAGDNLLLKVGVEGRVLLGPAGAPGAFTIPIRIAVRNDATQKVVSSQLNRVGASIPAGGTETAFSYVSEPFTVPFVPHPDEDYVILVGFDPSGKGGPVAGARSAPRKRHR